MHASGYPVTLHAVVFEIFTSGASACDKVTRRAKFCLTRRANHFYDSRHPVPEEGALAIVTERWDGMRWTRRHRVCAWLQGGINSVSDRTACGRAMLERTAKSCGPDASMVGAKSRGGAEGPTGPTFQFP
jgi:hypothetical protein